MQPVQPIKFEEVRNISIEHDAVAVRNLAERLRTLLDVQDEYKRLQSPLQQVEEDKVDNQRKKLVRNALDEHAPKLL